MSSFFNSNNPAMKFLTNVCNLLFVNLCFIISCIPLFTIGASITAMFKITIAILAGDSPSVFKDYIRAFKENFKKSTLGFIGSALLISLFVYEIYIAIYVLPQQFSWTQYPIYFFLIVICSLLCYAFPLIGWFDENLKEIIKNSALLAILNFPSTVFFIVTSAAVGLAMYQYTVITATLLLFMGFALIALLYSIFLKRIFEKNGAVISYRPDKD